MRLRTLGGLRLEGSDFARPKPLLLLTYLAVEGPQHRRHLSELFWPRAAAPLSSLRTALAQLRRGAPGAVEADGQRLRAAVPSDVQAVLAGAADPLAEPDYPGAFLDGLRLPDWGEELEEWVYATRELVAETVRSRLLARAEVLAGEGGVAAAAELAEAAYRLPGAPPPAPETIERAHRLLAAGGSPHAAALRREAEEYGIVLRAVPAAPAGRTATPSAPPTNLRPRAASFVGRDLELVELARLLADRGNRLVTLVGPGGAGKSSLAWAAAHQELRGGTFTGGVFLASLEGTPDAAVAATVADAMGLGPVDTVRELAEALGDRGVLLVLDGCEGLVGGLGDVGELLEACEGVTVLATSRERLGLPGEQLFPVDGLPLPGAGEEGSRAQYLDSVRLFAQRAKRVDLAFALDERSLPHVAAICRAVAGSPLGIELAAALVRVLTPEEIAAELERDLDLLGTADAGVPDRHRSLRAAFDHSWDRLGPRERDALSALAAFAGGFTREAASRVAGVTVPVLAALIDKSLVSLRPGGRYETHPLVRKYALERLARDPRREAAVRRELAAYLIELCGDARAEAKGAADAGARARLEAEVENVRAALARALAAGDGATALRLASAAWLEWHDRGRWREARIWLERAVAAWDASRRAGGGDLARAVDGTPGGAPDGDTADDPELDGALAEALLGIGVLAAAQGDLAEARRSTERGLAVSERRGDRARVGTLLNHLGVIDLNEGRFEAAEARLREALAVRRELGDERAAAATLNNLGALAGRLGDTASARRHYEESLRAFRRLGDSSAVAILLGNLGDVAEYEGDLAAAEACYDESLALHRRLGYEPYVARSLVRLAAVARRRDQADAARSLCLEALAKLRDLGDLSGAAECLNELALVLAGSGRPELAASAWGAMSTLLERANTPLQPSLRAEHEEAVAAARDAAGDGAFDRAWRRGSGFTLDDAVEFAREAAGVARASAPP